MFSHLRRFICTSSNGVLGLQSLLLFSPARPLFPQYLDMRHVPQQRISCHYVLVQPTWPLFWRLGLLSAIVFKSVLNARLKRELGFRTLHLEK